MNVEEKGIQMLEALLKAFHKDISNAVYTMDGSKRQLKNMEIFNSLLKTKNWTMFMLTGTKREHKKITQANESMKKSVIQKALYQTFVKDDLTMVIDREYYNLDCYVYQQVQISIPIYQQHCWRLIVAVEHENNFKGWTDELVKLCYIDAPIKMLIGYSSNPEQAKQAAENILNTLQYKVKSNEVYYILFGKRLSHNGEGSGSHIVHLEQIEKVEDFTKDFFCCFKVVTEDERVTLISIS